VLPNEFEEPLLDEGTAQLWNVRMMAGKGYELRLPALARWLEEQVFANGPVDDRIVAARAEEVLSPPGLPAVAGSPARPPGQ
jgi:hypothetical protein